jgi:hypothetical protein
MATLRANTFVTKPGDFQPTVLFAGDGVPDWAVDLVGEHLLEAGSDVVEAPPAAGKGSGIEAWRKYAAVVGVDFDADTSREALIEAVAKLDASK